MTIICLIIGIAFGMLFMYLLLYKKLQQTAYVNSNIIKINEQLKDEHYTLDAKCKGAQKYLETILQQQDQAFDRLYELQKHAEEAAQARYDQAMKTANESIENSMMKLSDSYQAAKEGFEKEYALACQESTNALNLALSKAIAEVNTYEEILADLKAKAQSAVEAAKREEEQKTQINFYRIKLTPLDIEEIKKLKDILPYIRNQEALNKIIWKSYYEIPTSDLIGRVIGAGNHTGIYKITHIDSKKCYVGQAVNLADRWRQHIKRGLGAETATKNKLYPAMMEYGPENFIFEVVEECDRSQLDEREDYWQEYFGAKEFGFSIK